ncbi:phenylalanine--tRNA ligase subunit beta [Candidatus Parcubacteria bacterium]|nr:MAG: phenylalanine--tRNA ligase subunit beta [Candidatus Parcubacteria bacterium]
MNILAGYNWIREYLKTDATAHDFAREFSLKAMSVESTNDTAERFAKYVIGVVVDIKDHPNANKLKIAITDIGNEEVEIVCGGNNLTVGMKVAVALPGAMVLWHGQGNWTKLEKAKIRGVESFGMICAPEEMGLEKANCPEGGIWDLTELTEASAGTPLASALFNDEVVFDIEVTTNRPDAMSIIGLAREGAAAIGADFITPDIALPKTPNKKKEIKVEVKEKDLCPRYMAVVIDNVKVGPSPAWLQMKLLLAGHRPINNIVDITNYVLHEYGQPLHAFDYDKLNDHTIIVRRANAGERITALDDNEYELSDNDLIIADGQKPVAVAGVMGGKDSGTWEGTKTIVFEAATFKDTNIRKTSRRLNLYSDSQSLFEKGLSTEAPSHALARAIELTLQITGGAVASEIIDIGGGEYKSKHFRFYPNKARELLGVNLPTDKMVNILQTLGFILEDKGDYFDAQVPYWRDHDIENDVDLIEEVARIYGYHNIPSVLPLSPPPDYDADPDLRWEELTKRFFANHGCTEFYGYSFVSADDLQKYDLNPEEFLKIYNPLSIELVYMRPSLIPSLLRDIEKNQGWSKKGRVFELAKIYLPQKNDLPQENTRLAVAEFGVNNAMESFLRLKGLIITWGEKVGLNFDFQRLSDDKYWHPTRTAAIIYDGKRVGVLGQVADKYLQNFNVDKPVMVADLDFAVLVGKMEFKRMYKEIPEFPSVERDVAIVVDEKIEFNQLSKVIKAQTDMLEGIGIVDVYQGEGIPQGKKSVTLSLSLRASDRTLSSDEVDRVITKIINALKDEFSAILR